MFDPKNNKGAIVAKQKIGEFMASIEAMTYDQVHDVLSLQEKGDTRRFGDIALEKVYLEDNALKRYVDFLEQTESSTDENCVAKT